MAIWPFQPSRASQDADRLLSAVTEASRRPALFAAGRIPDTMEGRFEAMTLHGALALIRLRSDQGAAPLAQAFTDKLFRLFDAGLRETGVGDMAVAKQMRRLAASFYGRLDAYAGAITAGDNSALAHALERNALGEGHPFAGALATYAIAAAAYQADTPIDRLFVAEGWPALAP
jgi:cytochrome b pre-mRNA-processing protein 3